MEELGLKIQKKREEMLISIEDVSNALKISKKLIIAIESGNKDEFFSKTYYHGYLEQYLQFLDMKGFSYKTDNFNNVSAPLNKTISSSIKPSLFYVVLSTMIIFLIYHFSSKFFNDKSFSLLDFEVKNNVLKIDKLYYTEPALKITNEVSKF